MVLATLERACRIALDRFKADSARLTTEFQKDAALQPYRSSRMSGLASAIESHGRQQLEQVNHITNWIKNRSGSSALRQPLWLARFQSCMMEPVTSLPVKAYAHF